MNRKELIRKQTWKYFWQQKFKEVSLTILIIGGIIFLPYLVGSIFVPEEGKFCGTYFDQVEPCSNVATWGGGFASLIILAILLFFLGLWIEDNWEKAEERAKKDYRRKSSSKNSNTNK